MELHYRQRAVFLACRSEWGRLRRLLGRPVTVYALNANTGVKLWSYATGEPLGSSPAVANGVVYIGSEDKKVYALNASTGAKLWRYATGNAVYSSPAVANGVVYVGSGGNEYALNASTGALLELRRQRGGFLACGGEWGRLRRLG